MDVKSLIIPGEICALVLALMLASDSSSLVFVRYTNSVIIIIIIIKTEKYWSLTLTALALLEIKRNSNVSTRIAERL